MTYEPLSSWQKPDCINQSASYRCPNQATQEAVFAEGNIRAAVRCCGEEACMVRARELAQVTFDALTGAMSR